MAPPPGGPRPRRWLPKCAEPPALCNHGGRRCRRCQSPAPLQLWLGCRCHRQGPEASRVPWRLPRGTMAGAIRERRVGHRDHLHAAPASEQQQLDDIAGNISSHMACVSLPPSMPGAPGGQFSPACAGPPGRCCQCAAAIARLRVRGRRGSTSGARPPVHGRQRSAASSGLPGLGRRCSAACARPPVLARQRAAAGARPLVLGHPCAAVAHGHRRRGRQCSAASAGRPVIGHPCKCNAERHGRHRCLHAAASAGPPARGRKGAAIWVAALHPRRLLLAVAPAAGHAPLHSSGCSNSSCGGRPRRR